mmetsp:Transcript_28539/g.38003  ORF Transcript_28539/g.38003 Transcript_28539/m.38003 type:complete len:268 (-) Transcript_28539:554-1357(-)
MVSTYTETITREDNNGNDNNMTRQVRGKVAMLSLALLLLNINAATAFHAGQMRSLKLARRSGTHRFNTFDLVVIGNGSKYEGDFDFPLPSDDDSVAGGEILMREFRDEVRIREMRVSLEQMHQRDQQEARMKNRQFSTNSRSMGSRTGSSAQSSAGLFTGSGTSVYSVPIARMPSRAPVSSQEAVVGFNILGMQAPDTTQFVQVAVAFFLFSFALNFGYSDGSHQHMRDNGFSNSIPVKIVNAASVISDAVNEVKPSSCVGASAWLC